MSNMTTRDQIIEAADRLFYKQGYEHTSFADIADTLKISRGNFYHHFKSKDEILDAVIRARLDEAKTMLEQWEIKEKKPTDRIRNFINILITNQAKIKRYGCPIGTLCNELGKLNHVSQTGARELFTLYRTWLRRQFVLLGRKSDADELSMRLLVESQGIATLANAFHDEKFIKQEVKRMRDWLKSYTESVPRKIRNTNKK